MTNGVRHACSQFLNKTFHDTSQLNFGIHVATHFNTHTHTLPLLLFLTVLDETSVKQKEAEGRDQQNKREQDDDDVRIVSWPVVCALKNSTRCYTEATLLSNFSAWIVSQKDP